MALRSKKTNPSERGQTIALYAIILPLMAVFLMGLLDYMTTSVRVMDAVAIGDLAAHAGAQEIEVLPNAPVAGLPIRLNNPSRPSRKYF